jgi:nucleoside-diphosphate-sugar epimerase
MEAPDRAVWVDEALVPQPRDIYDITKLTAEQMCRDVALETGMRCLSLRVGRFWDEPKPERAFYRLYRGLDEADVVQAHLKALANEELVYEVFNIAAQSPFGPEDLEALYTDARPLIEARVPEMAALFSQEGWELPRQIDRVYVIDKARELLGYAPTCNARELAQAWLKAEVG